MLVGYLLASNPTHPWPPSHPIVFHLFSTNLPVKSLSLCKQKFADYFYQNAEITASDNEVKNEIKVHKSLEHLEKGNFISKIQGIFKEN
jgi:hypothetical protein